jgi:hypothetical protein
MVSKVTSDHVCSRIWENLWSVHMVTHVKGNTDKCNHAQQLKHENKVPIKYYDNQDTNFSCNKKN